MMKLIGEEIEGQPFLLRDSAFKEGDKYIIKIVSMQIDLIKGVDIIHADDDGIFLTQITSSFARKSRSAEDPESILSLAKAFFLTKTL